MFFNLNNQQYYCQYWKKHFEVLFAKQGLQKTNNRRNVDVGHFNFATKIGYGFPNCHLNKKIIHDVYKNESYYPRSISLTKHWALNNRQAIEQFIDNKRTVLKNDRGVGGHTVYPVYNYSDVMHHLNDKNDFILQEEIKPLLHNGIKLDERVYLLIVKEDTTYSGYIFKEGHVKLAGYKFSDKGKNMGSFATNIKAPKPSNQDGGDFTIDTTEFLQKNVSPENQKKWNQQRLNIMKKITEKIIPIIAQRTRQYYSSNHKRSPKYLWHLYGIDLLVDDQYNLKLCEFNGKPGVIYDSVMPRKITTINRKMADRIFIEFLAPWLLNQQNRYTNDATIVKMGEFVNR